MTIKFLCPSGHRLRAPESQVGRTVRCPVCKQTATVPQAAAGKSPLGLPAQAKGSAADKADGEKPAGRKPRPPKPPKVAGAGPAKPAESAPAKAKSGPPKPAPSKPAPPKPPTTPAKTQAKAPEIERPLPKPPPPPSPAAPAAKSPVPPEPPPEAPRQASQPAEDPRRRRRRRHADDVPPEKKKAKDRHKPPKPKRQRRTRRSRLRRGPKVMGAHVYRPDRGRVQTTQWLAFFLGLVILFSIGPAAAHVNIESAPGWARLVLLMAALEGVFVVWMVASPDWASVWVVMLVFGSVSTIYAVGTSLAFATPLDRPMPLGLGQIRPWAGAWFGSVLAVQCLGTYLCGRTSTRWRRAFELEMAGRVNRPAPGG